MAQGKEMKEYCERSHCIKPEDHRATLSFARAGERRKGKFYPKTNMRE